MVNLILRNPGVIEFGDQGWSLNFKITVIWNPPGYRILIGAHISQASEV
jgi:hypothetical protein